MNIWGTVAGGFAGTLVLTTALSAAGELGLTRMDLPFLLGTMVSSDRSRAKALGYAMHFVVGQLPGLNRSSQQCLVRGTVDDVGDGFWPVTLRDRQALCEG